MKTSRFLGVVLVIPWLLGTGAPPTSSPAREATPVDIYQDMAAGADGDRLTAALLNASSHGGGKWSIEHGPMWVSAEHGKALPGPVVIGQTRYAGTSSCTWRFHDDQPRVFVACELPRTYKAITVADYYTPGVTIPHWQSVRHDPARRPPSPRSTRTTALPSRLNSGCRRVAGFRGDASDRVRPSRQSRPERGREDAKLLWPDPDRLFPRRVPPRSGGDIS